TQALCVYAGKTNPGRTLPSFRLTGRSSAFASAVGVRITCKASTTACLQVVWRNMLSLQEQKARSGVSTTPYSVPSPLATKPRISVPDCEASVSLYAPVAIRSCRIAFGRFRELPFFDRWQHCLSHRETPPCVVIDSVI